MARTDGTQNGVFQVPNVPADFLQKFVVASDHFLYRNPENGDQRGEEEEEEEAEIELNLGLSLNGRFGTDERLKKRKNYKLALSSSMPEGFACGESLSLVMPRVSDTFELTRTRSLPAETEELQSLRMEAKRRRSEKTSAFGGFHASRRDGENVDYSGVNYGFTPSRCSGIDGGKRRNDCFAPGWYSSRGRWCGAESRGEKGNVMWSSRRSPGAGGAAELEIQGTVQKPANTAERKADVSGRATARNILEKMPIVTTREVGLDGKRVEGFLYRYGMGEEVRIVCVCHGKSLSPAEFVKHGVGAGNCDVVNPLRQIVVTTSFLL